MPRIEKGLEDSSECIYTKSITDTDDMVVGSEAKATMVARDQIVQEISPLLRHLMQSTFIEEVPVEGKQRMPNVTDWARQSDYSKVAKPVKLIKC